MQLFAEYMQNNSKYAKDCIESAVSFVSFSDFPGDTPAVLGLREPVRGHLSGCQAIHALIVGY